MPSKRPSSPTGGSEANGAASVSVPPNAMRDKRGRAEEGLDERGEFEDQWDDEFEEEDVQYNGEDSDDDDDDGMDGASRETGMEGDVDGESAPAFHF